MTETSDMYGAKRSEYFGQVRTEILPLLPDRAGRVLEIGCGSGETLAYLKKIGICDWIGGIEISPDAAEKANEKLDFLLQGNIETMDPPLEAESIDVILCLDVLEHLIDPWAVIGKLHGLLRPGGVIIASIPNIRNLRVLIPLVVFGRFDYQDEGILDRTHLRFFTRSSAIELMECSGLRVEKILVTGLGRGAKTRRGKIAGCISSGLNILTLTIFRRFFEGQYLIRARNVPE